MWPSMVTHTRNLSSAFNPSKCTLTAVNTHLEQWAAIFRRPGSSWGIGALLKGLTSVVVLKVERALVFTPPTDNPCRTWESNRQPLGYKSNSLTIRPRLPHIPASTRTSLCFESSETKKNKKRKIAETAARNKAAYSSFPACLPLASQDEYNTTAQPRR